MALDGAFMHHICKELNETLVNSRVDKIHQPNKDELVFIFRGFNGASKLLMSARANSPRVSITKFAPENPKTPPMLCMLLRKRLSGARLVQVYQPQMERMLCLDFDATDDLGDKQKLTLAVEIMGKYSNVIFMDESKTIIDALKRVDMSMSSQRLVLPGLPYEMPPKQNKINMLEATAEAVVEKICDTEKDMALNKAILASVQGVSPIVTREIEYLTGKGADLTVKSLDEQQKSRLTFFIAREKETIENCSGIATMVKDKTGKPVDFCYTDVTQYGSGAETQHYESCCQLLDDFYSQREKSDRMHVKSQDLLRLIANAEDRLTRKINSQQAELSQCADREELRIKGDLLQANLYRIEKGAPYTDVENFYDENCATIRIKLNPAKSATANAQKYYKDYRKAKTAEQILQVQIENGKQELIYINSVFESLTRAETERELAEIRQELKEQGYIKHKGAKEKTPASLPPLEFTSETGFKILVGRNNKQNDKLTLKQARNNDLWFHTKNIPGSHTVIITDGKTPDDETILQAAQLAAYHSKAKDSDNVPVDYTQIRNVSKPQGAKPGMVIYVNNKTLYVTPRVMK